MVCSMLMRKIVILFQGHLILLDLYSEVRPQYSRFESFYGHFYIWNMLHDFGGNNYLFGTLDSVNRVGSLVPLKMKTLSLPLLPGTTSGTKFLRSIHARSRDNHGGHQSK